MKQVLRFLALAALICVPWVTQAQQAIPYSYGFEDDDLSADGWTTQLEENSSGIDEDAAHNGTYGFLFSYDETEGYLLSPVLTGTTNGVALSFYYTEYDDSYGDEQFYVGYTTDENNTDPSTYTYGSIVTASLSWQLYEITFPANTKRVAIKYVYNNAYYLFLDDFTFSAPPSCVKPTAVAAGSLTTTGADLTWTAGGTETNWVLQVATNNTFTEGLMSYDINGTPTKTLTDLTAQTTYYVHVKADCGGEEESDWSTIYSFTTLCAAVTVFPWTENFNGLTDNYTIPNCWNNDDGTTTTDSYKWYYNTSTSVNGACNGTSHDGTKCVVFNSYSNSSDKTNFLKTPALSLPSTPMMQLTFWYKNPAGGDFSVYISTDGGATYTTPLATGLTGVSSWTEHNPINLSDYAGENNVVIVFKGTSNWGSNDAYIYLDDVKVEEIPSCVKPTSLTVSDITSDQATISWTENGTAESWQYSLNDGEPVTVTTNPYTITGLTAHTSYTIKLRADCGGSQSEYTAVQNFSTTAVAVAVGDSWSDDFEGVSCGWELVNGTNTNKWCWGTATNNGGTHAIYVSNDDGATTNYSASDTKIFATKLLQFADGKYEFSYDWLCKGESTYDFLRVALVPASQTLTAGTDYSTIGTTSLPSGWIALDGGGKLNLQEAWQTKVVTINVAAGNYYMVLVWRNDPYVYPPAAAVDNVSITRVACPYDVEDLEVADDPAVTTTTATINWTAGEATQWQVATKTGDADWVVLPTIYSTNSAALTGLTATTTYQVKARAYCNANDQGTWCDPISLTTACPPVYPLDYTCGFEGPNTTGSYQLPLCWTRMGSSTSYPYISSSNYHGGTHSLYFYTSSSTSYRNEIAALPAIDAELNTIRVSFYGKVSSSTSDNNINIGYVTDLNDPETFTLVETVTLTTSHEKYTVSFRNVSDNNGYIAIQSSYSSVTKYIYIDDITVEEIPSCVEPSALQFVSSTTSTANIQWTAVGNETSWDIYYSTENVAPTTQTGTNTSDNPATIAGLTASTTYYVWVRAHCSDADQSPWIGGISFATECAAFTVDAEHHYTQDFNGYAAGSTSTSTPATYPDDNLPLCWKFLNRSDNSGNYPQAFLSSSSNYAVSGNCLFFKSSSSTPLYAILPEFTSNISDLMLTFTYRNESTGSSNGTLYVSYMTDPTDASTFNTANAIECDQITTKTEMEVFFPNAPAGSYIAFKYQGGSSDCYYLSIDNVSVEPAPTCRKPSALACDSKTAHTATLSWTNGEVGQTEWQVSYSTDENFDPNSVTPVDVTSNPATIEGLAQSTTYYAYVRANCGNSDYSAWNSTKVTFTTIAGNRTPTGLTVDNSTITSSQATASWTPRDGNTLHESYDIYWALASVEAVPLEPTAPNLISGITATSQVITGLAAETQYKVWVRDNCGTDGYSNWSNPPVSFQTASACETPDGLAASNVTNNSATISWNTYGQSIFNLRYSTDGANWTPVEDVNGDSYTINGTLTGNTAYQVQVQPTCADAETWSAVFNFTTKCEAITAFPVTYGFETSEGFPANASTPTTNQLGNCWRNQATVQNGTNPTRVWGTSTSYKHDGSQALTLPDKGNSTNFAKTMLAFPAMDFTSANGYTVSFWIYRPGSGSNPEGFKVYASHTDTIDVNAVELGHYSRNYNIAYPQVEATSGWYQYEINIPQATMTGTVYLIFEGQSYYGQATYVDDIIIDETPTCSKPSGLTFESATTTTATISWTAGGTETAWDIYYSENNEAPTNVTTPSVAATSDNPATLDGLDPATTYYVWVRAHCSDVDQSPWIGGISFTTECEAITTFPWTENFNSLTEDNSIPVCWNNEDGTTTTESYKWCYNTSTSGNGATNGTSHDNSKCVRFESYYNDEDNTNFLKTPTLSLPAEPMQLTFWYKNPAGGDFSVYISTDGGTTYTTALATDLTDVSSWTKHAAINLSAYAEQEVVLVFKGTSNNGYGNAYIYLDDVTVEEVPFSMAITANQWYAISSPAHDAGETDESISNITNLTDGTYDLLGYDEGNAAWKIPTGVLERGKGYIYRTDAAKTLTFNGTRNSGNIDVDLDATPAAGTMKGWNLIGNPYPHEITRAHISQASGYLVSGYYTLQASGSWRAEASTTAPIAVGQAILVKVTSGGKVTFSETAPATKAAPASTIAFTVSNDEFTDIAYARFSSEEGLPKISHLNPEAPMLSIDGYAIANLNEGTESFPMSFSGNGEYTLTVSGNTNVTGYLHLVDRLTGRDIDLLSTPSYSFTGSPVSDRFTVKLTPDANEGLSTSRFAIFDGNSLIVNGEGTLEVYDVMGRRLMSAEVTGSEYRIPGSDLHTGVYVLRMNGNSQKIVIK